MALAEKLRLEGELRAASVLLHALVASQADPKEVRSVFENAVVRETAHMLERGARSDTIRAFETAAGAWAVRSRSICRQSGRHEGHRASVPDDRLQPKETADTH